jgi:hypothetical protein
VYPGLLCSATAADVAMLASLRAIPDNAPQWVDLRSFTEPFIA